MERYTGGSSLHFLLHAGRAWVAWAFRGSPVGGATGRSGDLDAVGRYRGTRDSGEKGDGRYTDENTNQTVFEECWSESIIKNGLSPSLVDDPLFRKALVTTARMGQSAVCMGKGTALGKRDTTLPHRVTFSTKIIPATDKRLDEEGMARLKPRMKKVGGTLMFSRVPYMTLTGS